MAERCLPLQYGLDAMWLGILECFDTLNASVHKLEGTGRSDLVELLEHLWPVIPAPSTNTPTHEQCIPQRYRVSSLSFEIDNAVDQPPQVLENKADVLIVLQRVGLCLLRHR